MNEELTNWVKKYSREMISWAYHKTSSKEVAQDLVQETFLSAVKYYDSFEGRSQSKTWLMTILNNKIKEYYKKKSRSVFIETSDQEISSRRMTDEMFDVNESWKTSETFVSWEEPNLLDNPEFINVMEQCLGHLPEKWRIAVVMKYRIDNDPQFICQELDISLSNYWQIIHRAKLMLKKCVDINW